MSSHFNSTISPLNYFLSDVSSCVAKFKMKDSPQHAVKYVECACAGVEGNTKPFPTNDTANVASFCLSIKENTPLPYMAKLSPSHENCQVHWCSSVCVH